MAFPDDLGRTDGWVYHYTTAPTALEHILPEMKIRLAPVCDANDPWESRSHAVWVGIVREPQLPSVTEAARRALEETLGRARVACFTQDAANEPDPEQAQVRARSSCGWAQDRMWAQYANGHRGVCLAFDKDLLLKAFDSELAEHGPRFWGAVAYGDEPFESGSIMPSEAEAEQLGPASYSLQFRERTVQHRYFTKRRDWEGEREWRLVLFDDHATGSDAFVSVEQAFRAVVVGHRFADAYQPVVKSVCERLRIPAFKMLYSGRVALSSARYDQRVVRTV